MRRRVWYWWMILASFLPKVLVEERATRESVERDVLTGPAFWFDASMVKFFRGEQRFENKLAKHYQAMGVGRRPDEETHEYVTRARQQVLDLDIG